jgi:hypothetical protein
VRHLTFGIISLVAIVMLLCSCGSERTDIRELARTSSPDKLADVVVASADANATVSLPYEVYVVRAGGTPQASDLVLRIDKSLQPTVNWIDKQVVSISCSNARVWQFRNFQSLKLEGDQFLNVRVALSCGERGFEG